MENFIFSVVTLSVGKSILAYLFLTQGLFADTIMEFRFSESFIYSRNSNANQFIIHQCINCCNLLFTIIVYYCLLSILLLSILLKNPRINI